MRTSTLATVSPRGVGLNRFFSISTYFRSRSVEMIWA